MATRRWRWHPVSKASSITATARRPTDTLVSWIRCYSVRLTCSFRNYDAPLDPGQSSRTGRWSIASAKRWSMPCSSTRSVMGKAFRSPRATGPISWQISRTRYKSGPWRNYGTRDDRPRGLNAHSTLLHIRWSRSSLQAPPCGGVRRRPNPLPLLASWGHDSLTAYCWVGRADDAHSPVVRPIATPPCASSPRRRASIRLQEDHAQWCADTCQDNDGGHGIEEEARRNLQADEAGNHPFCLPVNFTLGEFGLDATMESAFGPLILSRRGFLNAPEFTVHTSGAELADHLLVLGGNPEDRPSAPP